MIQAKHLTKTFDDITALNDLSLTIEEDQVFGLVGTNGAGKSTFLNLASGVRATPIYAPLRSALSGGPPDLQRLAENKRKRRAKLMCCWSERKRPGQQAKPETPSV